MCQSPLLCYVGDLTEEAMEADDSGGVVVFWLLSLRGPVLGSSRITDIRLTDAVVAVKSSTLHCSITTSARVTRSATLYSLLSSRARGLRRRRIPGRLSSIATAIISERGPA